jgi:CubicO group peptidase (beta-lactamase class C family)
LFHVPRSAGGHPRTVITVLALALVAGLAFAGWRLWPDASVDGVAQAATVSADLPARPPVVEVTDLPALANRLQAEADAGRFMGAVLVARGDRVLFRKAYGPANIAAGEPLALDSKFRLASLSKQFTAAAVLKLQDEGKLSVDDPVCRWIQPCPEGWEPIRVRHLLSHTSGIPDLMQRPGWGAARLTPKTPAQLLAETRLYKPSFEPGTRIRYSNAGFNLAGDIVALASGRPYLAYLREDILAPLGMADTGFDDDSVLLATGYAHFPAGLTPQPESNASIVLASGGLYSTIDDMLAWNRALHGGRLLSVESYGQMVASHNPPEEAGQRGRPPREYGFGLFGASLGGRMRPGFYDRQIYHTGSWAGFRNLVTYQPDADVTVIVLSNNYHAGQAVLLISQQAMAEALGRPIPEAVAER